MENGLITEQRKVCSRFSADFLACSPSAKVGVSLNVRSGARPINGLRVEPTGDTCGWYLWGGEEWSDDPNFFVPLHVEHLLIWEPIIVPYLGLPPGWRFLISEEYEDVWKDNDLIV